ncbi:HoxN/HupN/NixA family nickel/cobalt transporter [Sporobolomyces salmoneus]|uniref:HoxN/HupN/NixA family nickel/cobalt transporter n=1 Tax=Sporobolomyces salmoneus TaxID=183962 RepID=UPI00317C90EE
MATEDDVTPAVLAPVKPSLFSRYLPTSSLSISFPYRLTLFGRSVALLLGEFIANVVLWIATVATFAPHKDKRGVVSLALLAWTFGLRHGLDFDHIVAIDNVTRNMVSMGKLPVTVGLFFSLGHSTIVIAMTIAIIVAVSAIDKLPQISEIGGLIGVSVSASFLFILGVINSIVLWQTLRLAKRRKQARLAASSVVVEEPDFSEKKATTDEPSTTPLPDLEKSMSLNENRREDGNIVEGLPATTCFARIGRPIFKLIDRPWKMYPVGVLFGMGFDTASEISLLGVSALASGRHDVSPGQIILLPFLFTAGMSAVDSIDSVFMLSAYTVPARSHARSQAASEGPRTRWWKKKRFGIPSIWEKRQDKLQLLNDEKEMRLIMAQDQDKLLSMSVVLTVISIVVALLISITEFMGLALEECKKCSEQAENDPGLSGQWWRFWAAINDNSGYLGAGVVGIFVCVFGGWAIANWWRNRKARKLKQQEQITSSEE